MRSSIAHVLCPFVSFSTYGFCASLCFCKASDQCYQWLMWVQMVSDTTWIMELAEESIVLLTSTLTLRFWEQRNLGNGWNWWWSLFCNLAFSWLWGGTVTQRALVVLRPFFFAFLPHTTSSLSLLCRREVQFHWTLNGTFRCSWREAEERRTWITHNKETHINCIYLF